jgi:pimeloyl-ACP methyl ester carboxylesterase
MPGRCGRMIREFSAPADLATLLADPVFRGRDVPRGDGRLVVVMPGLFGNDLYLEPLRYWLRYIGYSPVSSSLWVNAGCLRRLQEEVLAQIARRPKGKTNPIALIGHSRGGVLARAIAGHLRGQVSHVVTLGSPMGGFRQAVESGQIYSSSQGELRTMIGQASRFALRVLDPDCRLPSCGCEFLGRTSRARLTPPPPFLPSKAATMRWPRRTPSRHQRASVERWVEAIWPWYTTPRSIGSSATSWRRKVRSDSAAA